MRSHFFIQVSILRAPILALSDLEKAGILHQDVSLFNLLLKGNEDNDDKKIRRGLLGDLDYAALMNEIKRNLFKIPEIGTSSLPRKGPDGNIESEPVVHKILKEISGRELLIRELNVQQYKDEIAQKGIRTVRIFFCRDN